jgi:hypothetical protein
VIFGDVGAEHERLARCELGRLVPGEGALEELRLGRLPRCEVPNDLLLRIDVDQHPIVKIRR